ncbi:hypothetical protein ACW9HW_17785, partial [Pseudomonas sp. SDO5532_S415]
PCGSEPARERALSHNIFLLTPPPLQNCTKYDLFRSELYRPHLPAFRKQVIHISTHSKWGQLWKDCKISPQKPKKIRDLFESRVFNSDRSFIDQLAGQQVNRGL